LADLVALIEDGLGGGVGFGDEVFPVVLVPEQFGALETGEEF